MDDTKDVEIPTPNAPSELDLCAHCEHARKHHTQHDGCIASIERTMYYAICDCDAFVSANDLHIPTSNEIDLETPYVFAIVEMCGTCWRDLDKCVCAITFAPWSAADELRYREWIRSRGELKPPGV